MAVITNVSIGIISGILILASILVFPIIAGIIHMFSKTKDDSDTCKKSEDGVWSW